MKEISIKWLIILLLVCLVIALVIAMVLLLHGDNNRFSFFHFKEETKIIVEQEYNKEEIKKIVADTSVSDIQIIPSENEKIKVVIYGEETDKAKSELEQNTLTISAQKKTRICFGFCFFGKEEIIIYLPENEIKEIELKTISGDIKVSTSLKANTTIKTTSGDISLNSAADVDIHSTSGDINVGDVKNASIISVSGEIKGNTVEGKAIISTTSGDIKINRFLCKENSEIKSVSGEVKINNVENAYIETKTVSGESDIANNNRKAEYTLSIKTTSGDIKVN